METFTFYVSTLVTEQPKQQHHLCYMSVFHLLPFSQVPAFYLDLITLLVVSQGARLRSWFLFVLTASVTILVWCCCCCSFPLQSLCHTDMCVLQQRNNENTSVLSIIYIYCKSDQVLFMHFF
jgi:hypothetical protein